MYILYVAFYNVNLCSMCVYINLFYAMIFVPTRPQQTCTYTNYALFENNHGRKTFKSKAESKSGWVRQTKARMPGFSSTPFAYFPHLIVLFNYYYFFFYAADLCCRHCLAFNVSFMMYGLSYFGKRKQVTYHLILSYWCFCILPSVLFFQAFLGLGLRGQILWINTQPAKRYVRWDIIILHWHQCKWQTHFAL